jgi:hypothetical protein
MKTPLGFTIFRGVVIAAVAIVAGVGLYLGGAPAEERARRLDQQRLSDLDQISSSVNAYYQQTGALPKDILTLLRNPNYSYLQTTTDPSTGVTYEYHTTPEARGYELCGVFETDTTKDSTQQTMNTYPNPLIWKHGTGRVCFPLTATEITKPPLPVQTAQ